jgi:hypothetical protein
MPRFVGVYRALLSELCSVYWACFPNSLGPKVDPLRLIGYLPYLNQGRRARSTESSRTQGLLGAPRGPKGTGRAVPWPSTGLPLAGEVPKNPWEHVKASSEEGPGGSRSQEKPGGARRSQEEPGGAGSYKLPAVKGPRSFYSRPVVIK